MLPDVMQHFVTICDWLDLLACMPAGMGVLIGISVGSNLVLGILGFIHEKRGWYVIVRNYCSLKIS